MCSDDKYLYPPVRLSQKERLRVFANVAKHIIPWWFWAASTNYKQQHTLLPIKPSPQPPLFKVGLNLEKGVPDHSRNDFTAPPKLRCETTAKRRKPRPTMLFRPPGVAVDEGAPGNEHSPQCPSAGGAGGDDVPRSPFERWEASIERQERDRSNHLGVQEGRHDELVRHLAENLAALALLELRLHGGEVGGREGGAGPGGEGLLVAEDGLGYLARVKENMNKGERYGLA